MTTTYLVVFVSAILLSFVLTRTVRNVAIARGWVSAPSSSRHIHTASIPRLGGIAIFAAFALVAGVLAAFPAMRGGDVKFSARTILYILIPGTLVFLLGLFDDLHPVRPAIKFAVQAVAATLLFFGGFRVFQLPLLFGSHSLGWLALPVTIIWVLWITNAFNLLDGIDGLAAGSSLFSTLTVFVVSLVSGDLLVSSLTLALAGAILGFLRFNFNPATIFLGDCGSLFIGFMLSALALAGAQKTPTIVAVAIPVVSFGLPVLETVLSVIRRYLSGQPLFAADRGHIHHKLLDRGFSQQQVVWILYVVSAACGLLSLFLLYPSGPTVGVVLFVIGVGIWVGVQHLGYHEFVELRRVASRTMEQKKIIVNNLAIRRASRALSKAHTFDEIREALHDGFRNNDFDGYRLQLYPVSRKRLPLDGGSSKRLLSPTLSWGKPAASLNRTGGPEWKLTLELAASSKRKLGSLLIHREYSNRQLLIDINLLFSGFNVALADACERAQEHESLFVREIGEAGVLAGAFVDAEERTDISLDSLVSH
ncbi:MAG TPA: MraY family glycosyltransferase [Blastocatellia bacterium]|jgi:UDP-GlcNAc:undecaprenyl-phosphate GlcNAc-1-phosphate transferase|nr:MraY family glycosyltransferase [Blastocatellia bacterium]